MDWLSIMSYLRVDFLIQGLLKPGTKGVLIGRNNAEGQLELTYVPVQRLVSWVGQIEKGGSSIKRLQLFLLALSPPPSPAPLPFQPLSPLLCQ